MKNKLRLSFALMLAAFIIVLIPMANSSATATQDQPTLAKDSLQIRAFRFNVYKGTYDNWSCVPEMKCRVNVPIASGSQLYVQYSLPTGPWVKFDCETNYIERGH